MTHQRVIVILGSESDQAYASKIGSFLDRFKVGYEFRVASAHKNPEKLIRILGEYEKSNESLVYVTVAGMSNALSGFVDFKTRHPVIACPPSSDDLWRIDIYSSLRMPKGVAPLVICNPENAALAAMKILGESNKELANRVIEYQQELRSKNEKSDLKIKSTGSS